MAGEIKRLLDAGEAGLLLSKPEGNPFESLPWRFGVGGALKKGEAGDVALVGVAIEGAGMKTEPRLTLDVVEVISQREGGVGGSHYEGQASR
eukprot:CAMPEP_0175060046 /NCGR_PEP_ID=MMETSP0052_2-20121109/12774_1 /TAXON_ID=51329 ORGANISM="Polytomella parva, Strain SAG 63-3" /NCGR_SAMPLE_ID=MMETSP0052_2 /ASSEMBLY_ACC=CAM_ASM_000194 /LENGTH=91 /DNA_ID=CAMNT_0016325671 /DNA_START=520 /DNA_END=795 /DNA_ORIENTATION=+